MTIGIIVVNIIVFVLMSISGSTLDAQYMAATEPCTLSI